MEYSGVNSEDQTDIAEMLNSFFKEVGPSLSTILKRAPFWGVNFSLVSLKCRIVRNMRGEGVKFYDTADSSLGNLTSVIYPRSRGWGKGKNLTRFQVPREGLFDMVTQEPGTNNVALNPPS